MNVIPPDRDEPELFAWWQPLLAVARRLRVEHHPFTIDTGEFRFRGWVKRRGKPTLFVYENLSTLRDIICAETGCTYVFKRFESEPNKGRIAECALDNAMFEAGLPIEPLPDPGDYLDVAHAEAHGHAHSSRRTSRPWSRSRARLSVV